ncbi:VOC family protein [Novipirellula galeiformis]|uniref:VOC family protein n=1 Tax=Novipirellula galeiformis TaxID=2528004 RepID=UPI0018CC7FD2|nr:VOC family protein [Novipirellula galeiformis]
MESRSFGFDTLQAAISVVHADTPTGAKTNWNQLVALYSVFLQIDPSPVVDLNWAVAVAMEDGPDASIAIIDACFGRGESVGNHLAHSARGELLRRAGQTLTLYVDDVDAFAEQAFAAGMTVKKELADQFYGDRMVTLNDPYGYDW